MRDRVSLLILTFPPLVLGIVVGVVLVAAQTLVVYPERRVAPEVSLGVVYLPGVLVVSMVWGLTFGASSGVDARAFARGARSLGDRERR